MSGAAKAAGAKQTFSTFRTIGVPLAGFGIGWVGYNLVDQYQWIDPSIVRHTHIANLKLQRFARGVLPTVVADRAMYSSVQLDSMIQYLEAIPSSDATKEVERVPFRKILEDCRPQEQLEWLSDHIVEEVPYFFIADIFHSWADLHEAAVLNPNPPQSTTNVFESKLLCEGVWKKMLSEVLPFDVAVRVLCVLAVMSPRNAEYIGRLRGGDRDCCDTILNLHKIYKDELTTSGATQGNVVPAATVDASTALLLTQMDRAAIQRRSFPWIGRSSNHHPLLTPARRDAWCLQLQNVDVGRVPPAVGAVTQAYYQCSK